MSLVSATPIIQVAETPVATVPAPTPVVVDVGGTVLKLKSDITSAVESAVSNFVKTVEADTKAVESKVVTEAKTVEADISKVISGHWFLTGFLAASVLWLSIVAFSLHADKLALIEKAQAVTPTVAPAK